MVIEQMIADYLEERRRQEQDEAEKRDREEARVVKEAIRKAETMVQSQIPTAVRDELALGPFEVEWSLGTNRFIRGVWAICCFVGKPARMFVAPHGLVSLYVQDHSVDLSRDQLASNFARLAEALTEKHTLDVTDEAADEAAALTHHTAIQNSLWRPFVAYEVHYGVPHPEGGAPLEATVWSAIPEPDAQGWWPVFETRRLGPVRRMRLVCVLSVERLEVRNTAVVGPMVWETVEGCDVAQPPVGVVEWLGTAAADGANEESRRDEADDAREGRLRREVAG